MRRPNGQRVRASRYMNTYRLRVGVANTLGLRGVNLLRVNQILHFTYIIWKLWFSTSGSCFQQTQYTRYTHGLKHAIDDQPDALLYGSSR